MEIKEKKTMNYEEKYKETIEEKETYDLIRNATLKRQCYNCALKEECKKERPDTYEPIGTCDKWEDEKIGR